jgi:hypothetical protein
VTPTPEQAAIIEAARKIPLTRGLFAVVDAVDYEYLMCWKWHANKQSNNFYAARLEIKILMHNEVWKRAGNIILPTRKHVIDHINRNSLDNRRANLRQITNAENTLNSARRGGISFRGEQFSKPWRVRVRTREYERLHLGVFATRDEAQEALNAYANT